MKATRICTGLLLPVLLALWFGAAGATDLDQLPAKGANTDNPGHPLGKAQQALKLKAFHAKLKGKVSGPVAEVARGQFVELEREGEDLIWTVLAEFGDEESPFGVLKGGDFGPQRNQIPEPDRNLDNTTIWATDFSREHYEELLFSEAPGAVSMRNYYIEQSANRYTVDGDVTDWVQVPYRTAHYGRDWCGSIVCSTTWWFIRDSLDAWYQGQLDAGKTPAEIDAYLSKFDVWDRYDYDQDGNFDEPDGYIDHFQSVHAGEGQETGGGSYRSDAIWSHRWYVQLEAGGPTLDDGTVVPYGGTPVGGSSRYWIGDYTIEPENGGVGVFAHEFGHDLGLPDLYDTSGNTGGAENSTAFWTLMSAGSYGNTGIAEEGIGSKPIPMSAYEKIFLGWSKTEVVQAGAKASVKLGPSNYNTRQAQHLVVLLPDKKLDVEIGEAYSGDYFYFSGSDNNLDNSMTRSLTLPAGTPMLQAKVNYDIEVDWDYAYVTVDGTPIATSLSTGTDPNGQNFGNGITGSSGGWIDLSADLSAWAGQTVEIGFRYWTDVAVVESGMFVDDIEISGQPLDDAETDFGWTHNGFDRSATNIEQTFFNAYFAEYRTYKGYDDGLRTGPYNFGFGNNPALGNWVEHYSYQDGLLVWYYDTSFADNNVGDHCASGRCGGLVLPVDAHPELLLRPDTGNVWSARFQAHDSTFTLQSTEEVCLSANSITDCYGGLPANPLFDDSQSYWVAPDASIGNRGWASVPVPDTGTTIRVRSISARDNFMQVHVNK